jgi:WD40 repeat protein
MQMGVLWWKEWIISVSLDGSINYLDVANPDTPSQVLQGSKEAIVSFTLDAKNGKAYSGDSVGQVTEWDIKTSTAKWFSGKGHGKAITGVAVGDNALYSIGRDDALRVNSLAELTFGESSVKIGGANKGFAVSNNNPNLAACILAQDKFVVFVNGQVSATVELKFEPYCFTWSADDAKVLIYGSNKAVVSYDISTAGGAAKNAFTATGFDRDVSHLKACPDGKKYAAVDKGKSIYIFDEDGKILNVNKWQYHNFTINAMAWNPSGTRLATGSADESINVFTDFDKFTAQRTCIDRAIAQGVIQLAFVDDDTLVGVGVDRSVRFFTLPPLA